MLVKEPFAPGSLELKTIIQMQPLGKWWVLNGGGAMVYHLRHRPVIELDFFRQAHNWDEQAAAMTAAFVISDRLPNMMSLRLGVVEQLQKPMGTTKVCTNNMTLSLVRGPKMTGVLQAVGSDMHLPVASLTDAVGAKLYAVSARDTLHDYLDLATVIESGWTHEDLIKAANDTAQLVSGSFSLRDAFAKLAAPPEDIGDELTGHHYDLLLATGRAGLAALPDVRDIAS